MENKTIKKILRGITKLNVHIPKIICMDCRKEMIRTEGTSRRVCGYYGQEVEIEVL